MTRPCFLVIDREYAGSISTRKLVIETAKLNVITAYSVSEAEDTLRRFPAVDAVVLDSGVAGGGCASVVRALKSIRSGIPVIVIGTPAGLPCDGADHFLESFEPAKLLDLLGRLDPAIEALREEERRRFGRR